MRSPSVIALVCLAPAVPAQVQFEAFEFPAQPGTPGAEFGKALDTDGTWAVIGAPEDSLNGPNRGAAYLYDLRDNRLVQRLEPAGLADGDRFGVDVDVHGDRALIGTALGESAYLYDLTTGQLIHELVHGTPNVFFGGAVALNDTVAVVGTPGDPFGGAFVYDLVTGLQLLELVQPQLNESGGFGSALAINGTLALVAEPVAGAGATGQVHVYDLATGALSTTFAPADGGAFDVFGVGVAFNDTHALIGAPEHDTGGVGSSGAAYVFDLATGLQVQKLTKSVPVSFDQFGTSVALSDTTALVGCRGDDQVDFGTGATFLYLVPGFVQVSTLLASDAQISDQFGDEVALSDSTVLVGAWRADPLGPDSGSAYRFATPFFDSGQSYCEGDGSGTGCPCGQFGDAGEGCANTTGAGGARLSGMGGASLTDDWFVLHVLGAPESKPGLVLRGSAQVNGGLGALAGDGLLCTSGSTARSQVQLTTGGVTTFSDFNGSSFGVTSYGAGVPTNYQFWYRDPGNVCSGAGFNFTNAWTVTWTP